MDQPAFSEAQPARSLEQAGVDRERARPAKSPPPPRGLLAKKGSGRQMQRPGKDEEGPLVAAEESKKEKIEEEIEASAAPSGRRGKRERTASLTHRQEWAVQVRTRSEEMKKRAAPKKPRRKERSIDDLLLSVDRPRPSPRGPSRDSGGMAGGLVEEQELRPDLDDQKEAGGQQRVLLTLNEDLPAARTTTSAKAIDTSKTDIDKAPKAGGSYQLHGEMSGSRRGPLLAGERGRATWAAGNIAASPPRPVAKPAAVKRVSETEQVREEEIPWAGKVEQWADLMPGEAAAQDDLVDRERTERQQDAARLPSELTQEVQPSSRGFGGAASQSQVATSSPGQSQPALPSASLAVREEAEIKGVLKKRRKAGRKMSRRVEVQARAASAGGKAGADADLELLREARSRMGSGDYSRALVGFDELRLRAHGRVAIQSEVGMAQALEQLGRTAEAIRVYKRILKRFPSGPHAREAMAALARLYERSESVELARRTWQRYLKLWPKDLQAQRAMKRFAARKSRQRRKAAMKAPASAAPATLEATETEEGPVAPSFPADSSAPPALAE